jgi:hypothetical protein
MMDFRDAVSADVDNVFFNTEEFAENAMIGGKSVPIILDDDALQGKSDVYAMGLAEGERLIFIKEKDLRRLPQPGEQMTIGDKQWYVRHVVSNTGIFELRIGRNKGNHNGSYNG